MHTPYAHSLEGRPPEEWQTLDVHLNGVFGQAVRFAQMSNSSGWGLFREMVHDPGCLFVGKIPVCGTAEVHLGGVRS